MACRAGDDRERKAPVSLGEQTPAAVTETAVTMPSSRFNVGGSGVQPHVHMSSPGLTYAYLDHCTILDSK